MESNAGKKNPPGGKGSTSTTHLRVKDNKTANETTSDGSSDKAPVAY